MEHTKGAATTVGSHPAYTVKDRELLLKSRVKKRIYLPVIRFSPITIKGIPPLQNERRGLFFFLIAENYTIGHLFCGDTAAFGTF
jgi:hypothetical protein